jgi:hypothetical protein
MPTLPLSPGTFLVPSPIFASLSRSCAVPSPATVAPSLFGSCPYGVFCFLSLQSSYWQSHLLRTSPLRNQELLWRSRNSCWFRSSSCSLLWNCLENKSIIHVNIEGQVLYLFPLFHSLSCDVKFQYKLIEAGVTHFILKDSDNCTWYQILLDSWTVFIVFFLWRTGDSG